MKANSSTWPIVRKFFNDIHLWLGLISGLVIFLVCLSGTIYTYQTELVEMSAPHLHQVQVPQQAKVLPFKQMSANIQPKDSTLLSSIQFSERGDESYEFTFSKPGGGRGSSTTYFVNPYSGEVLGNSDHKTGMRKFMGYMFSLHRWLLLDKIETPIFGEFPNRKLGSWITGICTILFTLGVITGIVIWFPNKLRSWKQGLKIKVGGSWKRTNHDLHNTLGLYSCIVLFLMGVTGPFFSFDWYRTGLRKALGTYEAPKGERGEKGEKGRNKGEKLENKAENAEKSIAFPLDRVAQYVQKTNEVLPYTGKIRIGLDEDKIVVNKYKVGFFAPAAGDEIEFKTEKVEVEKLKKFSDKTWNQKVSSSIKALHMGTVFGGFSKLLYFISCLIATSLPVTGTLIWLNKMKKKK